MTDDVQLSSGVVVPPASFTEAARPDLNEIATVAGARDITRGWVDALSLLLPQDDLLRSQGGGYDAYRRVLSDWQVASTLQQRRDALVGADWRVEPGDTRRQSKAAAAFLEQQLRAIDWDRATRGMHYGVYYGYAVSELLYAYDGAHVVMDAIKVRDRRRFAFAGDGSLRLKTTAAPQGEALPPRKFWTFATGADHDDEPYGLGLAHWVYWPVLFKRNGIKFWLIAAEKFGSPTAVGWFPPNADAAERTRLLYALKAIQTDAALIMPEGMRAELMEAKRSGSADYAALCDYMDRAIAKVVLGQVMTSEAVGGQYKAGVQDDVKDDLVKADADLICESFNRGPARWLTEWNFQQAAPPRVFRQLEAPEDLGARAERERKIFDLGYRPTLAQVTETYGGAWEAVPERAAPPVEGTGAPTPGAAAPPAAFAEAPPADVADAYAARLGRAAAAPVADWLVPVAQLLGHVQSLAEFRDGLAALYPQLDPAAFAGLMQQALAAAELAGRFEVLDGR